MPLKLVQQVFFIFGCHAVSMFLLLAELLDWLEPQHSSSMTSDLVYQPSFI